jgi:pterin-4a-carbinolamine dehydratase
MQPAETEQVLETEIEKVTGWIVRSARARLIMAIRTQDFATINICMNELADASKIALRRPDDL